MNKTTQLIDARLDTTPPVDTSGIVLAGGAFLLVFTAILCGVCGAK